MSTAASINLINNTICTHGSGWADAQPYTSDKLTGVDYIAAKCRTEDAEAVIRRFEALGYRMRVSERQPGAVIIEGYRD